MQPQRRPRESLTPQQLREWYASWGCRGGRAATAATTAAATAAAATGGGQMQLHCRPRESRTPQQLREWYAQSGGSLISVRCSYVIRTGARTGQPCGTPSHTQSRCFARLSDAWRTEFGDGAELPDWVELLRQRVDIFALDYDAILTAMYALPTSVDRACYLCVPPDPGIAPAALGTGEAAALGATASPALGAGEAAALGATASSALGAGEAAAPGPGESALSGSSPAATLHTFTLDSGASRSFFRDCTTLTPLSRPVAVSLADPSRGPVLAHYSTVLPCLAAPSSLLSGLYLPSFSTNLVSGADLQDGGVDQFTPARQRVTHCTCARTGRHLATFTREPGSSLYTLTTESPQVAASASASGQLSAPCLCRALSHETLLWHHRLGHPSVQRLRSMHRRVLVSGLPRVLPPLPPSPAPPCLPCVEGRQRAAPHSSFPPTEAPLQTLHLDVWGPARVRGQDHERYFLLVVDDYTRYTTVFPLRTKGEVPAVLIPWIRAARLQLRRRFGTEFPVLRLHSNRGGEFSSDLLAAYCAEHGITQSFTLPASPQQNGVAERRIGLVMEVARTSMVHAAAPHFLWPFAVRYAAHQLNLWPRVSLPETSPTLLWTGEVGDASRFRVWGSRAFVRDTTADKLSARAVPCVFLGFVPDAPGWQFYHPTSRRVFASQDVTFDESVPFYRLFPYRTAPLPPPPLFLAPGAIQVDPLPAPGPAPSGVSQVDPPPLPPPVEVTGDSGPAWGAASGGAEPGDVEPGGAEPGGAEPGGAEPGCAESGGAEPGGSESGRAAPGGTVGSGERSPWSGRLRSRSAGASPLHPSRRPPLSPQQLREWYAARQGRAARARGPTAGGAGAGASTTGVVSTGGSGATEGAGAGGSGAGAGAGGSGAGAGAGAAAGAGAEGSESAAVRSPWSGRLRPRVPLTSQQLHDWYGRRQGRAAGARGSAAGGTSADVPGAGRGAGPLSTGGAGVAGPGGARTGGTGAAGAGGAGSGGAAAGDVEAGDPGTGGAGSGGAAAGGTGVGDPGPGGVGSGAGASGAAGGAGAAGAWLTTACSFSLH
ncbi:unnamed protein product [Closterium sp. Yama58-4]|nr:unnamed protein product [Closterium sp. Yama58-4]